MAALQQAAAAAPQSRHRHCPAPRFLPGPACGNPLRHPGTLPPSLRLLFTASQTTTEATGTPRPVLHLVTALRFRAVRQDRSVRAVQGGQGGDAESMVDAILGAAAPLAQPQSPASLAARPLPFAASATVAVDARESARSTPISRRPSAPEFAPTSPSGSLSPASYLASPGAQRFAAGGSAGGSRASSVHGSRSPSASGVALGWQPHSVRPASGRTSAVSTASSSHAATEAPSARSTRGASLPPLPGSAPSDALRGRTRLRGQHTRSFSTRSSSGRGMGARRRPSSARTAGGRGRASTREGRDSTVVHDPRVRAEAQLILQEQLRKHLGLVQEESIEDALPLGAGFRTPGGPARAGTLSSGRLPPMDPEAVNEAVRRLALIGGAPPVDLNQRPRQSRSAPVTRTVLTDRTESSLLSVASDVPAELPVERSTEDPPAPGGSPRSSEAPAEFTQSAAGTGARRPVASDALIDPAVTLAALADHEGAASRQRRTAAGLAPRPPSTQDTATPSAAADASSGDGDGSATTAIAGALVAAAVGGPDVAAAVPTVSSSPASLQHAHGDADTQVVRGAPGSPRLIEAAAAIPARTPRGSVASASAVPQPRRAHPSVPMHAFCRHAADSRPLARSLLPVNASPPRP